MFFRFRTWQFLCTGPNAVNILRFLDLRGSRDLWRQGVSWSWIGHLGKGRRDCARVVTIFYFVLDFVEAKAEELTTLFCYRWKLCKNSLYRIYLIVRMHRVLPANRLEQRCSVKFYKGPKASQVYINTWCSLQKHQVFISNWEQVSWKQYCKKCTSICTSPDIIPRWRCVWPISRMGKTIRMLTIKYY